MFLRATLEPLLSLLSATLEVLPSRLNAMLEVLVKRFKATLDVLLSRLRLYELVDWRAGRPVLLAPSSCSSWM